MTSPTPDTTHARIEDIRAREVQMAANWLGKKKPLIDAKKEPYFSIVYDSIVADRKNIAFLLETVDMVKAVIQSEHRYKIYEQDVLELQSQLAEVTKDRNNLRKALEDYNHMHDERDQLRKERDELGAYCDRQAETYKALHSGYPKTLAITTERDALREQVSRLEGELAGAKNLKRAIREKAASHDDGMMAYSVLKEQNAKLKAALEYISKQGDETHAASLRMKNKAKETLKECENE